MTVTNLGRCLESPRITYQTLSNPRGHCSYLARPWTVNLLESQLIVIKRTRKPAPNP